MTNEEFQHLPVDTLLIISGEGTGHGTTERYNGRMTLRAVSMRLKKERCCGDRWARLASVRSNGMGGNDTELLHMQLTIENGLTHTLRSLGLS